MFRELGFAVLFLPPLIVFLLETNPILTGGAVPVVIVTVIYPLGILTLLVYSLSYRPDASSNDHFLDFSKGARLATIVATFGSAAVAIFPVFAGEPLLGPSLLFVSFGSTWLPSASVAGLYGHMLGNAKVQLSQNDLKGITHGGIATLFLAWFLKKKEFLKTRSRDSRFVVYLVISYVLGWLYLSLAGGFPFSLIGAVMALLVPLGGRRVLRKTLNVDDLGKLSGILTN
jgi:hypothetical protein